MPNMAPTVLFAFGPDSSYFYYCDGVVIHENCSWAFKQAVLPNIRRPYNISLGPGEDEYCAFYETTEDLRWMSANYPSTRVLKELELFLRTTITADGGQFHDANIVVARDGAYLAVTPSFSTDLKSAPSGLKEAVVQRLEIKNQIDNDQPTYQSLNLSPVPRPVQMSVGVLGAWFIRWQDGLCSWDLGDEKMASQTRDGQPLYQQLRHLLGHGNSKTAPLILRQSVDYLVLDPWQPQHWFIVMDNASRIEFSLTEKVAKRISPSIHKYLQEHRTSSTLGSIQTRSSSSNNPARVIEVSTPIR